CAGDPNSDACKNAITLYCDGDGTPAHPQHHDTLACQFPTGGLSLWEASIELRFPIVGDLGGAVFCDASDVSRYRFDLRFLYPHLSCGAGIHYDTPVGPIRLDAGFQLPGLQVLDPKADPSEKVRDGFFAIALGIGEAF
ncbi:MAG TPA: BamA/TamA family outer membrane protein, partial [Polyangiaceae bacterium]|nr:BamA/TamA family outer membrane protein [Polyangiaceae bacterium]